MTLTLGETRIAPAVLLAPMAGITDLPFRRLVARFGVGLTVSEMVASQEMVQAKPGVRERAELGAGQGNTAIQLAGRDPRWMAEAARMVEANGARVIDIGPDVVVHVTQQHTVAELLPRRSKHRLFDRLQSAVNQPDQWQQS